MTQQMPPEQPGQMPVPTQGQFQSPVPEKKKSWFARHKVLTGLGGALVLIIVISGAAGGGGKGSDDSGTAKADSSNTETAAKDPAATETASKKEAPKPAEKSKPGVGTAVTSGDFEFTVVGVEEVGTSVGSEFLSETAQGRYVRLSVKVANVGTSPKLFLTDSLTIIDQQGRSFNADTTATLYDQSNADTWISEINPGNAIEGGVVFDLPADAVATTLKVSGGGFSGSEEISLAG